MTPTLAINSPAVHVLAAGPAVLVSWWKPVLLLLFFAGWAWIVTNIYDKHAARFYLPRRNWNLFHMAMGLLALAVFIAIPVRHEGAFWIGLLAVIVILVIDLAAYMVMANRDERVPERHRIRLDLSTWQQQREAKRAAKSQAKVALTIKSGDNTPFPPPKEDTPEYQVRVAAEQLYQRAMEARASQIDIAPAGKDDMYAVSMLVDGVRQNPEPLPAPEALKIIDFWKAAARMDVSDRRKRQLGNVVVEHAGAVHKAVLTSQGTSKGMRFSMVFDPEEAVIRDAADLGLLPAQRETLDALVADPTGIVLVAAPPDNGLTTTLYALTRRHDAYTSNVQTVEIEPQASLEGVRTNKFNPDTEGAEFSLLVRSTLRRDPDIVSVTDLPDQNTAKEIARSDHSRTRVYLGVRADGALNALKTWVQAVGDTKTAAEGLRGLIGLRLFRKLCDNCKVGYQPSADMLKKLGIPQGKINQLFKKGGQVLIKNKPDVCPVCQGVGYLGQEGAFEIFPIDEEARSLLATGDERGFVAHLRKGQHPTIQQAAIRKALEGRTSVEEVMRVTAQPARQAATAKRPPEAQQRSGQSPQTPAPSAQS